jgi:trans-aconitate methyltransferase
MSEHWDDVYRTRDADAVSWFEPEATGSLAVLDRNGASARKSLIDVGGGASVLVDNLLRRGWTDVSVLDLAGAALHVARSRLGSRAAGVDWIVADVTRWSPPRVYDVWHDRAVFHFLTDPSDRAGYVEAMAAALAPDGLAVIAAFAPDGPERCSGLPVMRYDADELAAVVGPAFRLVDVERQVHFAPTGVRQAFTWAAFRRR